MAKVPCNMSVLHDNTAKVEECVRWDLCAIFILMNESKTICWYVCMREVVMDCVNHSTCRQLGQAKNIFQTFVVGDLDTDNSGGRPVILKIHYIREITEWLFGRACPQSLHSKTVLSVKKAVWATVVQVLSNAGIAENFSFPPVFSETLVNLMALCEKEDVDAEFVALVAELLGLLNTKFKDSFVLHLEHTARLLNHGLGIYLKYIQDKKNILVDVLTLAVCDSVDRHLITFLNPKKVWEAIVMKDFWRLMTVISVGSEQLQKRCLTILEAGMMNVENMQGWIQYMAATDHSVSGHYAGKLFGMMESYISKATEDADATKWDCIEKSMNFLVEKYKEYLTTYVEQGLLKPEAAEPGGARISDTAFYFRMIDMVLKSVDVCDVKDKNGGFVLRYALTRSCWWLHFIELFNCTSYEWLCRCLALLTSNLEKYGIYRPTEDKNFIYRDTLRKIVKYSLALALDVQNESRAAVQALNIIANIIKVENRDSSSLLENIWDLIERIPLNQFEPTYSMIISVIEEFSSIRQTDKLYQSILSRTRKGECSRLSTIFADNKASKYLSKAISSVPSRQAVSFIEILNEAIKDSRESHSTAAVSLLGSIALVGLQSIYVDLTNADQISKATVGMVQTLCFSMGQCGQNTSLTAALLLIYVDALNAHASCCRIIPSIKPLPSQETRPPFNAQCDGGFFEPLNVLQDGLKLSLENMAENCIELQMTDERSQMAYAIGCSVIHRIETLYEQIAYSAHAVKDEPEMDPVWLQCDLSSLGNLLLKIFSALGESDTIEKRQKFSFGRLQALNARSYLSYLMIKSYPCMQLLGSSGVQASMIASIFGQYGQYDKTTEQIFKKHPSMLVQCIEVTLSQIQRYLI